MTGAHTRGWLLSWVLLVPSKNQNVVSALPKRTHFVVARGLALHSGKTGVLELWLGEAGNVTGLLIT